MKVYLVYCEHYDCGERSFGSLLLGVYVSMERAITARDKFVARELAECTQMNCQTRHAIDNDNNPFVEKLLYDEVVEEYTYTIEEWEVQ